MTIPVYIEPDSIVLVAGVYDELDILLQPTGTQVSLRAGERLPRSQRRFVWRLKPAHPHFLELRIDPADWHRLTQLADDNPAFRIVDSATIRTPKHEVQ